MLSKQKKPPSDGTEIKGRDLAKRMYKILKKKRAREKKAKKATAAPPDEKPPVAPEKWARALRGGRYPKAVNRPVDEAQIEKLLLERDKVKAAKNYARADEIALEFQKMDVYYEDDRKEWHTRSLMTDEEKKERLLKLEQKRVLKNEEKNKSKKGAKKRRQ
jgi:hypothetical protein